MKSPFFCTLFLVLTTLSCEVAPAPIDFGNDQCHYCKMMIVDQVHAAQYVTNKGKQFKFDAIECMVNELREKGEDNLAILLVADYGNPGKMIPAREASYLISEQIKSPMGAYLSALESTAAAKAVQQKHTGTIHSWSSLSTILKNN
ncbi:MAG: nitrous oxide reductase accessory protein NosL [Lutibacter sp.]|nr:nitrous oxide reductase accessory protein NosL [Lutibacter sp.]